MNAKIRIGTFCRKCGKQITGTKGIDYIAIPTKGCGETRYTCNECANNDTRNGSSSYNDEVDNLIGLETKSKMQIAVEWECAYKYNGTNVNGVHLETQEEINAYMASQYHLLPTHDCTVDCEYKEERRTSLHGYKNRIQGISEIVDLTASNCGHHINISRTTWDNRFARILKANSEKLFAPLSYYMKENRYLTERVFGRYFTNYAEFTSISFTHGYWLNIRNDTFKNECCLEFRLAKFNNVNQYFYLMNMCKEIMLLVDQFCKDDYFNDIDETANELIELFKKYATGKALCMRSERNNSKAR